MKHLISVIFLCAACVLVADTGEEPNGPCAAPKLTTLPNEYRRPIAKAAGDREGFQLAQRDAVMIPSTGWVAIPLLKVGEFLPLKKEPFENIVAEAYPVRKMTGVGVLGIDTRSGHHVFLAPPSGQDLFSYDIVAVRPWGRAFCAVVMRCQRREEEDSDSPAWKKDFLWQWDPAKGTISFLGEFRPISSLATALDGSFYSVSWPQRGPDPWDGLVTLTNRETTTSFKFMAAAQNELEEINKGLCEDALLSHEYEPNARRFAPTADQQTLVVASYSSIAPLEESTLSVRCLDLSASDKVRWQLNQEDLDAGVGKRVLSILFVDGVRRPCHFLPMHVETTRSSELWSLNTQNGTLSGPHLRDFSSYSLWPVASPDGRVVVWPRTEVKFRGKTLELLVVLDLERGQLLYKGPMRKFWSVAGVDESGTITFIREEGVWTHALPYIGQPKPLFLLDTTNDPVKASKTP